MSLLTNSSTSLRPENHGLAVYIIEERRYISRSRMPVTSICTRRLIRAPKQPLIHGIRPPHDINADKKPTAIRSALHTLQAQHQTLLASCYFSGARAGPARGRGGGGARGRGRRG